MLRPRRLLAIVAVLAAIGSMVATSSAAASGQPVVSAAHRHGHGRLLASGIDGGSGSTIGPDGALYVTEGIAGRVTRIDRRTGQKSVFASGLPKRVIPIGGAFDIAFVRHTAYVLVSVVGPDVGGTSTVGIYRVDSPHSFTVIADIGAFSLSHPPTTPFFIPTGVQYAMQPYRGDLLVTDGHHNRLLRVSLDGDISEVLTLSDVVPTGLAVRRGTVYLTEAGPVPHLPATGKVLKVDLRTHTAHEIASGVRLAVDVEPGRGRRLYALSQGVFPVGNPEGSPASPDTGSLLRVHRDGSLTAVAEELDRPTSVEIVGRTAYVVTLDGEVWKVDCL